MAYYRTTEGSWQRTVGGPNTPLGICYGGVGPQCDITQRTRPGGACYSSTDLTNLDTAYQEYGAVTQGVWLDFDNDGMLDTLAVNVRGSPNSMIYFGDRDRQVQENCSATYSAAH